MSAITFQSDTALSFSKVQSLARFDTATLNDLFTTVHILDARQRDESQARQISVRMEPLISFVERYAKAVDILSQGLPMAAFVWGSLRILLEVYPTILL
jgi:hypothetical protein